MTLASKNQPIGDEFLSGREAVDSNPFWEMTRRSCKIPVLRDLASYINRSQTRLGCTPHICLKQSALHSGTLNSDNIKGLYYSLLAQRKL
jgi:hypothetical protein